MASLPCIKNAILAFIEKHKCQEELIEVMDLINPVGQIHYDAISETTNKGSGENSTSLLKSQLSLESHQPEQPDYVIN